MPQSLVSAELVLPLFDLLVSFLDISYLAPCTPNGFEVSDNLQSATVRTPCSSSMDSVLVTQYHPATEAPEQRTVSKGQL